MTTPPPGSGEESTNNPPTLEVPIDAPASATAVPAPDGPALAAPMHSIFAPVRASSPAPPAPADLPLAPADLPATPADLPPVPADLPAMSAPPAPPAAASPGAASPAPAPMVAFPPPPAPAAAPFAPPPLAPLTPAARPPVAPPLAPPTLGSPTPAAPTPAAPTPTATLSLPPFPPVSAPSAPPPLGAAAPPPPPLVGAPGSAPLPPPRGTPPPAAPPPGAPPPGAPPPLAPPPPETGQPLAPRPPSLPLADELPPTAAIFGGAAVQGSGREPAADGPGGTGKNWMGLAAVIASLVGAGLVGIVLGHLALRAVRVREATNRGLALAGTVLGYASVVAVGGALVATGALAGIPPFGGSGAAPGVTITPATASDAYVVDSTLTTADRWFGLALGDCILAFDTGATPGDSTIEKPKVVPCTDEHYGEVYAIASIKGDTPPDDATFRLQTREVCAGPLFSTYVGVAAYADSSLYYDVLYPAQRSWENGTHQMVCLLLETGKSTTGSLKGSGK